MVIHKRGTQLTLRGHLDEAISLFNAALGLYPRMNDAHFGIGLAHLRAGRLEQARNAYQDGLAVTDSPSDIEDALEELEEFRRETDTPAHVDAVQGLIKEWKDLHDKPFPSK